MEREKGEGQFLVCGEKVSTVISVERIWIYYWLELKIKY